MNIVRDFKHWISFISQTMQSGKAKLTSEGKTDIIDFKAGQAVFLNA
jgi:hypothetical protein